MKKQGVLIYDDVIDRMDIRFGPLDYYGGLHCGERLEVLLDGEWIPTRIELGEFWYLRGVRLPICSPLSAAETTTRNRSGQAERR